MPTTVTLDPNASDFSGGKWTYVGTGGPNFYNALNDASDATYLTSAASGGGNFGLGVKFPDAGLPDGAAIQSMSVFIRMRQAASGTPRTVRVAGTALKAVSGYRTQGIYGSGSVYGDPNIVGVPTTSFADYTVTVGGSYNSQEPTNWPQDVDAFIKASFETYANSGSSNPATDVARLRVLLAYVEAPIASSGGVTGNTTTTTPTISWITRAPDVAQDSFTSVVWATADQANFPSGQAGMEAKQAYLFGGDGGLTAPPAGVTLGKDANGPYFIVAGVTYRAKAWSVNSTTGLPGAQAGASPTWTTAQLMPATGAMKAYVRSEGTYSSQPLYARTVANMATSSFTMAVAVPVVATSVTPVWQYPAALYPNTSSQYRMKVDIAMPVDSIPRQLRIERSVSGSGVWALLPAGGVVPLVSTAAQTVTVYDTAPSPNKAMQYRVTAGSTTTVAWGSPVSSALTPTAIFDRFVLRNATANTGAVIFRVQGDLESSSDEYLGFFRGLGAALPVALSDAIGGYSWPVEVLVTSESEYQDLLALRATRGTLLLQGDMAGWYRWVRIGESWNESIIRQSLRKVENYRSRKVKLTLIETWPIAGQPDRAAWG